MHTLEKILNVHRLNEGWKEDFYFSKKVVDYVFGRGAKIEKEATGQR